MVWGQFHVSVGGGTHVWVEIFCKFFCYQRIHLLVWRSLRPLGIPALREPVLSAGLRELGSASSVLIPLASAGGHIPPARVVTGEGRCPGPPKQKPAGCLLPLVLPRPQGLLVTVSD